MVRKFTQLPPAGLFVLPRVSERFNAGLSSFFTVTEDASDTPSLWSTTVKIILCARLIQWPIDRIRRKTWRQSWLGHLDGEKRHGGTEARRHEGEDEEGDGEKEK